MTKQPLRASDPQVDPLIYYDLERYLFEVVHRRFHRQGHLLAFDLFSIVVWKSNRSKSKIAKKLLKKVERGNLDKAARLLTQGVFDAGTLKDKFKVLFEDWRIPLPMTSAILTVLYPEVFTVYDRRVCDQLGDHHRLLNLSNLDNLWSRYTTFMDDVRATAPGRLSLRDKDRYLFGSSVADQLKADIRNGFRGSTGNG